MSSHYQKAYFLLSAADISQLPPDEGVEIAMVGRSNAGKSSVLNKVTNIKGLARVSNTPGRTQLINVFMIDDGRRLIDLPGYGFAKVPISAKKKWQKLVDSYIQSRESLKGLIMVMDIRHPMKDLDQQLLQYCDEQKLAVHILLNKADKLSNNEIAKKVAFVEECLAGSSSNATYQVFSALRGLGVKELHGLMDEWMKY